jgi:hypothetical protein
MAKRHIRLTAAKTVAMATWVKFETKSGGTVSFRAVKTVEELVNFRFRTKKKCG